MDIKKFTKQKHSFRHIKNISTLRNFVEFMLEQRHNFVPREPKLKIEQSRAITYKPIGLSRYDLVLSPEVETAAQ
jgi:hypothetical protein